MPRRGAAERLLDLAGRPLDSDESSPRVWTVAVSPGYFEALGVGVTRGRSFSEGDGTPGLSSAIVNERFAGMFLEDANPIGQQFSLRVPNAAESAPEGITIVGVAPDIRQRAPAPADPLVYLPFRSSSPATAALIVRTTADARVTEAVLRGELLALDAGLPLYRLATMAAVIDEAEWGARMSVVLVHILTLLALGLSGVGLYAVTAYAVGQRTQEIGLRVALGASSQQVRRLIFGRALAQMALGLGLGILGALGWDRAFADGRPDVSVSDPASLVMVAAVLVAVMCLACFVPARRATRLDPIVALRHE
ncbi:MAG: FtsX-like permease family protein [Vicinamibacterales bacterium]